MIIGTLLNGLKDYFALLNQVDTCACLLNGVNSFIMSLTTHPAFCSFPLYFQFFYCYYFFVFRPLLVYSLLNDWSSEIDFVNQIVPMWRCGCLGGCGFIWALSCFWFYGLTKGMLKVLRGSSINDDDEGKKEKKKGI